MPESRPEPHDPSDPQRSSEDAAWREIVANFGDRAELPAEPSADEEQREPAVGFGDDVDEPFAPEPEDAWEDEDEGFVPPLPDPVRMPLDRRIAWAGVLGAPAAALIAAFFVQTSSRTLPPWIGLLLALAFLGGFGYLVATMPKQREDPWDDGARL